MNYTQGDWKIEEVITDQPIITAGGKDIAEVLSYGYEETLANAHLIAAAPDMYEALKKIQDLLKSMCGWNEELGLGTTNQYLLSAFTFTQKALAKAEGRD